MTAIWMTLNFLLIVLAFYLILQLFQRVRVLQTVTKQDTADLEKLFAVYLEDMKNENDRVIRALAESAEKKNTNRRKSTVRTARTQSAEVVSPVPSEQVKKGNEVPFHQILKKEETELQKQDRTQTPGTQQTIDEHTEKGWVPPVDEIGDRLEESLPFRALKLKEKGYTVTQIAKQLKMGKEEIELLLKFQGKKKL